MNNLDASFNSLRPPRDELQLVRGEDPVLPPARCSGRGGVPRLPRQAEGDGELPPGRRPGGSDSRGD